MRRIKSKLSYANVMVTILAFIALGGAAYAATGLPKNSVGTKQIKNGAVTGIKIKKGAITGTNINLTKLGTVPSATSAGTATTAGTADALSAVEPIRLVGTSGQPPFLDGSNNYTEPSPFGKLQPVGFYKDHEGVVHLEGLAVPGKESHPLPGLIFTLPPGDRPASGTTLIFQNGESLVLIFGSNVTLGGNNLEGDLYSTSTDTFLSGITFRAQS
jgi:hypothetical protein